MQFRKVRYAVVDGLLFELTKESFEDFLARTGAEVLGNESITVTVSVGQQGLA